MPEQDFYRNDEAKAMLGIRDGSFRQNVHPHLHRLELPRDNWLYAAGYVLNLAAWREVRRYERKTLENIARDFARTVGAAQLVALAEINLQTNINSRTRELKGVDEPVISASDIADLLDVNPATVRNWADRDGLLHPVRNYSGLFPVSDLNAVHQWHLPQTMASSETHNGQ